MSFTASPHPTYQGAPNDLRFIRQQEFENRLNGKPRTTGSEAKGGDRRRRRWCRSLEQLRVDYLGKKGQITALLKGLGQLSPKSARPRAPRSTW